jgi:copper transport protein
LAESSPANGQRLNSAPSQVTLRFTESVRLVEGGLELLDATGNPVAAPEPAVEGATVRWPMPEALADGSYLVNWRVISGDGHPVSGAFSFGVGVTPSPVDSDPATTSTPWQVTLTRLAGYLGFVCVAGVVSFAILCWPGGRRNRRIYGLLRVGLVVAIAATVVGLLLHGPYAAGEPLTRLFDRTLVAETAHTGFGSWSELRVLLYLALAAVLWPLAALDSRLNQWLAGTALAGVALTFAGTGHAAASGDVAELAVDSVHVLAAGIWLGGLVTLTVAATARSGRPTHAAIAAFSRLAMLAVLVLVATGTVNAILRLSALDQLWRSAYGVTLSVKIALVVLTLGGAHVSRRRVHRGAEPWASVRFEAAATLAVVAVTAVLASTPPPSRSSPAMTVTDPSTASSTVEMDLGEGRRALLHVDGLDTGGSSLHLELLDEAGNPVPMRTVDLQATLSARSLGPLDIELTRDRSGWVGDFSFPLTGAWTLTLAVEDRALAGVVTSGELVIG